MAELALFPELGNTISYIEEMGTETYEEMMKYCNENRILIFNKEIDTSIIESYVIRILRWNKEDEKIASNSRKPIVLLINSQGGDLFSTLFFIDVIKNSNTPIYAVGLGMVASAAYYIYINGHQRIAFNNTIFLQHDGTLEMAGTNSKVKDFVAFNNSMEERIKNMVISSTKITEDFYEKTFDREYYFFADQGVELGVVDKIIGKDITLGEIFYG